MGKLNDKGQEILDSTPVAAAIGFRPGPSLVDRIRAMVRHELSERAAATGRESFEEADDFEVGDDYDPRSPWELSVDQEDALHGTQNPSPPSVVPGSGGSAASVPSANPGQVPAGSAPAGAGTPSGPAPGGPAG